jgi:hypothetical protein
VGHDVSRIPSFLTLDTVTAADWRHATVEERREFYERERAKGYVAFVCCTCRFPLPRGWSPCPVCEGREGTT